MIRRVIIGTCGVLLACPVLAQYTTFEIDVTLETRIKGPVYCDGSLDGRYVATDTVENGTVIFSPWIRSGNNVANSSMPRLAKLEVFGETNTLKDYPIVQIRVGTAETGFRPTGNGAQTLPVYDFGFLSGKFSGSSRILGDIRGQLRWFVYGTSVVVNCQGFGSLEFLYQGTITQY